MFQLHVSALNMLSKCGEQFRRRYVEGERVPPGVAILIGAATDRSVSADLTNKITSGALLPDEQIKDLARDAVVSEWERGVELDEEYSEIGEARAKADAIDTSIALATLHHLQAAPGIEATHIQREWVLNVNGLPLQLAGAIDIQEGAAAIRDTKTSKKSPGPDEAHNSLQLTTYALAVKVFDGSIPAAVKLDYLVKTKTPKLVQLEAKRTDADFDHLLNRVAQAARIMESGIFSPAPIDAWYCSAKFCGYHSTCPYARKPVSVAVNSIKEVA